MRSRDAQADPRSAGSAHPFSHLPPLIPQRFRERLLCARYRSTYWDSAKDKPRPLFSCSLHSRGDTDSPWTRAVDDTRRYNPQWPRRSGKASLAGTECWLRGLGLGKVSQVELKPGGVCSRRRQPLSRQCGEGGRVQEMVGERAGPGYRGPRRPSENFRFLSRAVRSQGKLLSRRASDSLSS